MRLDGVEVKVSLDGTATAAAVHEFGLESGVPPWQIFFVEDVTAGLGSVTPLGDQHLIIRARQKASGKDDVTVKFRPGRRSQLTTSWLAREKSTDRDLDSEFKVEQDWAGDRRSLAVSLTSERPDGLVAATAANKKGVAALLSRDQERLIVECAGTPVNLDVLSMLPPVSALRWPTFSVPGPSGSQLKVRAERWTVQHLDFLELSIASNVENAHAEQAAMEAFVQGKGLQVAEGEAKTTQVLRLLVAQAAGTAT